MDTSDRFARTRLWLFVLSFASVLLISPSLASADTNHPPDLPHATVRLPGHVLPALSKATIVPSSTKSDAAHITLTLVLKRDDQPGFERFLHDLYDPKSPAFHHFLTQQRDCRSFRPQPRRLRCRAALDDIERIQARARLAEPIDAHDARHARASGESVRCENWRLPRSAIKSFYANQDEPGLPAPLAARIETITGLSDLARPRYHAINGDSRSANCTVIGGLCVTDWENGRVKA